jgi:hypothetical protein
MVSLESYKVALGSLPGVLSQRELRLPPRDRSFDAKLRLRTAAGTLDLLVEETRTHLTHKAVDHIIAMASASPEPVLILAPHIGAGLAAKLTAAGLNYLDAHGNCHISAPPLYIHIEGKTGAPLPRADKGIRSPGYQVLFAYLADTTLLDAPVRHVAERAGVSRQPVSDMRNRLLEEGYIFETKTKAAWHPTRLRDALTLWLHGYDTAVRSALQRGTYRTQDAMPGDLEQRLVQELGEKQIDFRWGGGAAAFRLTGHYRGETTVVHVRDAADDINRGLRAVRDTRGNLVLMDAFGSINWKPGTNTVHPLLVYSELLHASSERAREAAQEVYDTHLAPAWDGAS